MDTTLTAATAPDASVSAEAAPVAPVIKLTAAAVQQVKDVIAQQGFHGYHLTVRVVPAGCSGLGYDLNLDKDGKPGDLLWEQDGLKLATDPMSRKYLDGTVVDYVKSDVAAGFKFENPKAKSSCGCGTSFSV